MSENRNELYELLERVGKLSVADQVLVMEKIAAGLRTRHFADPEAGAKQWAEFVEEYVANDGHMAPYPVPPERLAQVPRCDAAKSTS
jgi:hypothetical protein